MSAVIKTITPFLNLELLLQALDAIDCKYTVNMQGNEIVTERVDYYGNQNFILISGRYVLQHDSSANRELYPWRNLNVKDYKTVSSFLEAVEINYNFFYNKKMEELEKLSQEAERIRLENERLAFVEQQRENIISKAKEKGYSIQEEKVNGKIKLILIRNTY
jgi:hypothetical protein